MKKDHLDWTPEKKQKLIPMHEDYGLSFRTIAMSLGFGERHADRVRRMYYIMKQLKNDVPEQPKPEQPNKDTAPDYAFMNVKTHFCAVQKKGGGG